MSISKRTTRHYKNIVAFGHVWRYDPGTRKYRLIRKLIKPTIGMNSCA